MKKRNIETTGIVGVEVTLNHSEMIVLKGFVDQANQLIAEWKADPSHDPKEVSADRGVQMLEDATKFFSNILPENVMSIEEAYTSLFAAPVQ